MNVDIRPASIEDLPAVFSVLEEAWLQLIGMTRQWPTAFSGEEFWAPTIEALTGDGQMYLATVDVDSVGAFHLRDEPELYEIPNQVWPLELRDRPCRYLYLLAVRRGVARQGVSTAMLDWAFEDARRNGRVLRLDCWAGNDKLRRFYSGAGFEYLGDVEINDGAGRTFGCSRFQRAA
jgi:GNAT superfamily N-acetyltransferase